MSNETIAARQTAGVPDPMFSTNEAISRLGEIALAISPMRVPLFAALVGMVVLTWPEQVREVYRVMAQERLPNQPWHLHWVLALASVIGLSLVLWQVARQMAHVGRNALPEGTSPGRVFDWLHAWAPRLIATLPLIGAAVGVWHCRSPTTAIAEVPAPLQQIQANLLLLDRDCRLGAMLCLLSAAMILLGTTLVERKLLPASSRGSHILSLVNTLLVFPLVILGSMALFISDPVVLPQLFGTVPIFAMWLASLTVLLALFSRYYSIFGVPLLSLVVIGLLTIDFMGLADNHRFRHEAAKIDRPKVEAAFRSWLSSRADASAYKDANKPYPIYVVAAEGGGLYSAYQAAKVLTRMQDLCANFAQHVFTISGVSGGGLGAAVFAGLTKSEGITNAPARPCLNALPNAGAMEEKANTILSRDFLSPIVWGGLFPDFLQRFIPVPIYGFDRARSLEIAFESAFTQQPKTGVNPFQASLFDLCGVDLASCAKGATPVLAFNVTNTETGMQMVLSPLDFSGVGPPWSNSGKIFDFFALGVDPVAIPLSTAVGLSARFPWITPGGWYDFTEPGEAAALGAKASRRRMTFADGAFVDNSGVATAGKLAQYLQGILAKDPSLPKAEIKLIMISAAWIPFDRFWMDSPKANGQGDLIAPLAAAYASWQGRGYMTQFDASASVRPGFDVAEVGFYYNYMPLPLGWQLSNLSRQYIDLFRGHPQACDESKLLRSMKDHAAMANSYINRANCVTAGIVRDLTPAAPYSSWKPITTAN